MGYYGLTGGIASGKSTVARMLAGLGAKVIDADRVGHDVLLSTGPAFREVVREFGREIVSSGEIDRSRLGRLVFADPAKLARLNSIVHPMIVARVEEMAAEYQASNPGSVVLVDAALIFEAGIGGRFAKVIVAWCRPEQQIERLMLKAGISRAEAEQRIKAQMPVEEKRRRADYLIDCSGSLEETSRQVKQLYDELSCSGAL